MMRMLSNGLVMVAGVVSVPVVVTSLEVKSPIAEYRPDPRLGCLQRFFEETGAPVKDLAAVFLQAADDHELDWRLLPSISFIESNAGKFMRNNNLFGWNEGRAVFDSMTHAIRVVARNLANSTLYRNKTVDEVLKTYNPDADYPGKVKSVMRRIGPSEL